MSREECPLELLRRGTQTQETERLLPGPSLSLSLTSTALQNIFYPVDIFCRDPFMFPSIVLGEALPDATRPEERIASSLNLTCKSHWVICRASELYVRNINTRSVITL